MKVNLLSDLHLEFQREGEFYPVPSGEVLILAGDICTAKHIGKNSYLGEIYRKFFKDCANNFDKVFYVMGNHCHYGYHFNSTAQELRKFLPDGVTLLDKEVVHYNGWNFMGATLWTNFGGANPLAMELARSTMNDYHTIRYGPDYRKLQPSDILKEFNETLSWMHKTLYELDGPVFVITHHQPSFQSLDTSYRGSPCNPFYASELSNFIIAHPQIKFWAAGHTHVSLDYPIEQCRVICNPRGYTGYEPNFNFNPNFSLTI